MDLSLSIGGVKFPNPVWTASGTFGYGLEFAGVMDLARLGGICTKGISLKPREGNAPPRIYETASGMLNSIGLENVGVEAFLSDKLPQLKAHNATVIANIYGTSEEEYVELARRLDGAPGLAALELNLSCPNVKEGGMAFGVNARLAASVTEKAKKATRLPVMVKLSPNVTDVAEIARALEGAGADALTSVNTFLGMSINPANGRFNLHTKMGGLSGPAIKPLAVRITYQVARAVKIPVIGIGGIMNVEDVVEYFRAGAVAVQVGTANFIHHDISIRILEALPAAMDRLGARRPADLRVE